MSNKNAEQCLEDWRQEAERFNKVWNNLGFSPQPRPLSFRLARLAAKYNELADILVKTVEQILATGRYYSSPELAEIHRDLTECAKGVFAPDDPRRKVLRALETARVKKGRRKRKSKVVRPETPTDKAFIGGQLGENL